GGVGGGYGVRRVDVLWVFDVDGTWRIGHGAPRSNSGTHQPIARGEPTAENPPLCAPGPPLRHPDRVVAGQAAPSVIRDRFRLRRRYISMNSQLRTIEQRIEAL